MREFYAELVKTQQIINQKFMGWRTAAAVSKILAAQLAHGQTDFLKMLFGFSSVYNVDRFTADYPGQVKVNDLLVHLKVNPAQQAAMRRATLKAHASDTAALPPGPVVDAP